MQTRLVQGVLCRRETEHCLPGAGSHITGACKWHIDRMQSYMQSSVSNLEGGNSACQTIVSLHTYMWHLQNWTATGMEVHSDKPACMQL